jgi:hypothetical protein
MKQKKQIIVLVSSLVVLLLTFSCTDPNSKTKQKKNLIGSTFYVLDEKVNTPSYYASIKEIKLDFFNSDKVEATMTLYADPLGYKIIKDSASVIYDYKYENGLLELPKLNNLIARVKMLDNGTIRTNGGEYLYPSSIVNFLGTDSALSRVRENAKSNIELTFFEHCIDKPNNYNYNHN